mgnify:CR=1 FL=1
MQMSKIIIDENKAKRVAYYVAFTFLLGFNSMRDLTHNKDKKMWIGLYAEVYKEFSKNPSLAVLIIASLCLLAFSPRVIRASFPDEECWRQKQSTVSSPLDDRLEIWAIGTTLTATRITPVTPH